MVLINILFCLDHHHRMMKEIQSVTKEFSEFVDTISTETKDALKKHDLDLLYHMSKTAELLDYAIDRVGGFCASTFREGASEDELDYLSGFIDGVVDSVKARISAISQFITNMKASHG